ncbi:MAG: hypothetical protein KGL92_08505 [Gammaproteobacteria bacterium]|nr:hypothetical protein [Gammaproteobacteria bacterium]
MSLKNLISVSAGVVGLIAAGASMASTSINAVTAQYDVSGSTALDKQLHTLLTNTTNGPCASIQEILTDISSANAAPVASLSGAHQFVVVCTSRTALGTVPAGTLIAIDKESNGGSYEGTGPVADGTALQFIDVSKALTCTGASGIGFGGFTQVDGCPTTALAPTFGVADEDPTVFTVGVVVTAAERAKLNTIPLFQNEFGIGVSLDLYRTLQKVQGLTVGSDTLANMPTLTHQQIAALMSGTAIDWSSIIDSAGHSIVTDAAVAPSSTAVFFCKRPQSSGTNAGADIYFLHNRCTGPTEFLPMAAASTVSTNCKGLLTVANQNTPETGGCAWQASNITDAVFPGAGTGDDVNCLTAHDKLGQWAFAYLGGSTGFDDAGGAGGVADTNATAVARFRFVAIDGHKPTLEGLINGTYDYAFDNVLNEPLTISASGSALASLFQSVMQTQLVSTLISTESNSGDANFAVGGLLDAINVPGLAFTAAPVKTTAQVLAAPVSAFTFSAGGAVNDCQVPVDAGTMLTSEAL